MQLPNDTAVPDLRPSLIDRLVPTPGAGERGAHLFARALLASADEASLAELPEAYLKAHIEQAFAFLAQRTPGSHRIAHRTAVLEDGSRPRRLSVIEILNDDMPFLLDSTLGEIQARAIPIALVLHPIFKVARDGAGNLLAVTGPGDHNWGDGRQESYISIHMGELPAADAERLVGQLSVTLGEVRSAVRDWKPMLLRLDRAIRDLRESPPAVPADLRNEAVAFLEWLRLGNFTFLGMRDYALAGDAETGELVDAADGGLGLLRDPTMRVLRRGSELVTMTPEVRRFFFSPSPLIITKANVIARVHRRVHMDYIGVKLYGEGGTPRGELRIVGLFTSTAYTQSPRTIPVLRHKVESVVAAFGAPPESHAGKALINVLETFPRDELFQISTEELSRWSAGILDLETRPRVRVFTRPDRFDRFVSVLVFVPRERYSSSVRERIGAYLADRFQGTVSAFYPSFSEAALARVHFIIGRTGGVTPSVGTRELEDAIKAITRTWEDRLADALAAADPAGHVRLVARYRDAFRGAYAETFAVERALEDIARIERLGDERPLAIDFYSRPGDAPPQVHAAIYRFDQPMSLSERVPLLENLGFTVIDERTFVLRPVFPAGPRDVVLHDMLLETSDGRPFTAGADQSAQARLEEAFLAIAQGRAENDGLNRLVAAAGANWRDVALIRAYAGYLRQLGSAFGLRYVSDTLLRHAGIVRDILELFVVRFDPDFPRDMAGRARSASAICERIEGALARVESLDEDRILRQLASLVEATVRTSFYIRGADGGLSDTIALKFDGRALDMAPPPRSYREIWVSGPRLDAVHLRFAPIARGGIRWSDRPLDFRTEVLGLVKAQQVKNAVIVPGGAKGGFFPKQLPRGGARDAIQKEGMEAYKLFIGAMLEITDDIRDGAIVAPERVVRHDGDDPYLVVAADKGTATFSDVANAISCARGFWLGDAFASGGSTGYDHKGIAITSRGAWECIKRHFREMNVDIETETFRVAGVGDMSGDVFGNGMLRSQTIRLVAAFDHRDIFLDPDPDPARSFAERQRLFRLPRSSWADYDRALISTGGGVFSRTAKSIPLSPEVRALLKLDVPAATPAEVMRAILKCGVDLLFFGGIGTYVRASSETDADVGDRSNDAIRITGAEIAAKVIGEGANLGMTQRGRIEAAQRGVRLNTDFIDNSAGVNCSDQEVNIKIALGPAVRSGRLTLAERNRMLAAMTADVAAAVLRNNYQQSLALSIGEQVGVTGLAAQARLIRLLESRGLLDRRLEALPDEREIAERQRAGCGLVRPELAILLSYAKIALLHDLLATSVPDDRALEPLLLQYFPPALRQDFADDLRGHRLRREIVATTLTNALVNRLGSATPYLLAEETSSSLADVARSYMIVRDAFALSDLWRDLDALDNRVDGLVQLDCYVRVQSFAVAMVRAVLRHRLAGKPSADAAFREIAARLRERAARETPPAAAAARVDLEKRGVPAPLAWRVAGLAELGRAPLALGVAMETGSHAVDAIEAVEALARFLDTSGLENRLSDMRTLDDYDRQAIRHGIETIMAAHAELACRALAGGRGGKPTLETWIAEHGPALAAARASIATLESAESWSASQLIVAALAIRNRLTKRPAS